MLGLVRKLICGAQVSKFNNILFFLHNAGNGNLYKGLAICHLVEVQRRLCEYYICGTVNGWPLRNLIITISNKWLIYQSLYTLPESAHMFEKDNHRGLGTNKLVLFCYFCN